MVASSGTPAVHVTALAPFLVLEPDGAREDTPVTLAFRSSIILPGAVAAFDVRHLAQPPILSIDDSGTAASWLTEALGDNVSAALTCHVIGTDFPWTPSRDMRALARTALGLWLLETWPLGADVPPLDVDLVAMEVVALAHASGVALGRCHRVVELLGERLVFAQEFIGRARRGDLTEALRIADGVDAACTDWTAVLARTAGTLSKEVEDRAGTSAQLEDGSDSHVARSPSTPGPDARPDTAIDAPQVDVAADGTPPTLPLIPWIRGRREALESAIRADIVQEAAQRESVLRDLDPPQFTPPEARSITAQGTASVDWRMVPPRLLEWREDSIEWTIASASGPLADHATYNVEVKVARAPGSTREAVLRARIYDRSGALANSLPLAEIPLVLRRNAYTGVGCVELPASSGTAEWLVDVSTLARAERPFGSPHLAETARRARQMVREFIAARVQREETGLAAPFLGEPGLTTGSVGRSRAIRPASSPRGSFMGNVAAVTQKVQRYLTSAYGQVGVDADGSFGIGFESAVVFVSIEPDIPVDDGTGDSPTYAVVWTRVLSQLDPSPDLHEWVAYHAGDYRFGSLSLVRSESPHGPVILLNRHTLLADYLDEAELCRAVTGILAVANEIDNGLQKMFGGVRMYEQDR